MSKLPLGALRMLSILSARTSMGAEMRKLLPTAVAEMRAVLDADAELADFAAVTTPTLMLSGGWSPEYFTETGRQLAAAVPSIEFRRVARAAPRKPAPARESGCPGRCAVPPRRRGEPAAPPGAQAHAGPQAVGPLTGGAAAER